MGTVSVLKQKGHLPSVTEERLGGGPFISITENGGYGVVGSRFESPTVLSKGGKEGKTPQQEIRRGPKIRRANGKGKSTERGEPGPPRTGEGSERKLGVQEPQ